MKKAEDYLDGIKWPFNTVAEITAALSERMRSEGVPHSAAQKGRDGLCLTCGGGAGLSCPGVHTLEEIQHANRLQTQAAQAKMLTHTKEQR